MSRGLTLMLMLNIPATMGLVVAGHADRPAAVRAWPLPAGGHGGDRGGAAAVCRRSRRLLGGANRLAGVLCAWTKPRAGCRQLVSIAINIAVSVMLARVMGFRGLALGTSIAAMVNGAMLFLLLRQHLHGLDGHEHHRHDGEDRRRDGSHGRGRCCDGASGGRTGARRDRAGADRSFGNRHSVLDWRRSSLQQRHCGSRSSMRRLDAISTGSPKIACDTIRLRSPCPAIPPATRRPFRSVRAALNGPQGTDGVNVALFLAQTFFPELTWRLRPDAGRRRWRIQGVAARHVHVSPRRSVPHPVQYARALDVRHRARADVGHAVLPQVLFRDRRRRGRS